MKRVNEEYICIRRRMLNLSFIIPICFLLKASKVPQFMGPQNNALACFWYFMNSPFGTMQT